ncbi:MAG: ubiquinol-cytochrome c reductase iron-sulfur subunit [Betaproteobacteria bacterium]|nr:ubiquinol-cytochrome c reductase iron-sulfur subunit [Betaproteobacteria bacterium]
MSEAKMDKTRRNLIVAGSAAAGAASLGAAVPFVWSMWPSERAKAAGAPVEADISRLAPGELAVVEWRGKPVWLMRRTKEMLDAVRKVDDKVTDPKSEVMLQPEYAKNEYRSIKPEYLVLIGICTHLGCSPQPKPAEAKAEMGADWQGGFLCPCHGSKFDLAGRVYKGAPAPVNLEVPPHMYLSDGSIRIGEDKKEG